MAVHNLQSGCWLQRLPTNRVHKLVHALSDLHTRTRVCGHTNLHEKCFFNGKFNFYDVSLSSIRSHYGYEIALFYYLFFYYYFLSALHFYDSYFFFFSMFVTMKSKLFCRLASKIGDFDSNYNTVAKQKKLLYDLCILHQEINMYRRIVERICS